MLVWLCHISKNRSVARWWITRVATYWYCYPPGTENTTLARKPSASSLLSGSRLKRVAIFFPKFGNVPNFWKAFFGSPSLSSLTIIQLWPFLPSLGRCVAPRKTRVLDMPPLEYPDQTSSYLYILTKAEAEDEDDVNSASRDGAPVSF